MSYGHTFPPRNELLVLLDAFREVARCRIRSGTYTKEYVEKLQRLLGNADAFEEALLEVT